LEFNDIEVFDLFNMIKTLQQAKRIIKIVIGFTVLITGLAMVVLPGPAILVIPAGLAILATEFVWAKRLLDKIRNRSSWHIK
jgi:tellurite resistance protein TerC